MRLDTNINNHEKSQALVGRFRDAMLIQAGLRRDPFDASHSDPLACTSVSVCIQNRLQISREIGRKLLRLQDTTLDHVQIRLLNDEVNKLVKLFDQWNYRIRQLGGGKEVKVVYEQGLEVLQKRGYKFFGRAKELEEAQRPDTEKEKKDNDALIHKKEQILARVDDFYFGHYSTEAEKIQEELSALEQELKQSDGPFEWLGYKKIPDATVLVPEFDVPTIEEATQAFIGWRKKKLLERIEQIK